MQPFISTGEVLESMKQRHRQYLIQDYKQRQANRIASYRETRSRRDLMQLRFELGSPVRRVPSWSNPHEDESGFDGYQYSTDPRPQWEGFSITRAMNVARFWASTDFNRSPAKALFLKLLTNMPIDDIASGIVKCADAGLLQTR